METYIRNFAHQIVGIIDTAANGDQTAREFPSRKILGYYIKDKDITTDFYHRVLYNGNMLTALFNISK